MGICQNPDARSKIVKYLAFADPLASKTDSNLGSGCAIGFVILLSFL